MAYTIPITKESLEVPTNLPHMEQVEKYRIAFQNLVDGERDAKETKEKAKNEKNAQLYLEADVELERIAIIWAPFMTGAAKAEKLKKDGYLISDIEGNVTPVQNESHRESRRLFG